MRFMGLAVSNRPTLVDRRIVAEGTTAGCAIFGISGVNRVPGTDPLARREAKLVHVALVARGVSNGTASGEALREISAMARATDS